MELILGLERLAGIVRTHLDTAYDICFTTDDMDALVKNELAIERYTQRLADFEDMLLNEYDAMFGPFEGDPR